MTQINMQYKVGIKRQVVQSLRKVFESPLFPDEELRHKINVELEYPIIRERYPAIYISYTDQNVRDSGLGNYYYLINSFGEYGVARQWFFEGTIGLTILALDPLERDELGAVIANILAFGKDDPLWKLFRDSIHNEEFVSLQPILSVLNGGTESVVPAPWQNTNEYIYNASYNIQTFGSFFTASDTVTAGLLKIEDIVSYPYRPGESVPQGHLEPGQEILVDWT